MVDMDTDFLKSTDNFTKTASISSIQIVKSNLNFTPKVTIAIPTYKRAPLLKEAIDSAINQVGYEFYDIIVVDNDPERGCETEKLLMDYNSKRISYYKNSENIGMAGNWNRLFELAQGEYVVMLHDDDLLYPNFLYVINKLLSKSNNVLDALYPQYNYLNNNLTTLWPTQKMSRLTKYIELSCKDFVLSNIIGAPVGVCLKKDKVFEIGGFDNSFYPSIDYAFYVKFSYFFNSIKLLNNELSMYRIHKNESQKLSTVLSFIEKDLVIKKQIVENSSLKFLNKLFMWYHGVANEIFIEKMARLFLIHELQDKRKMSETLSKFGLLNYINYKILNKIWALRFYLSQKSLEI